jgi:hypothetical protein
LERVVAESDKDVVVITHGGCWDGFCAAWLFHRVFPDAAYVPGYYGQKPPDVTGKRVFIADFSYPCDVMLPMCEVTRSLVVLDHHKTAQTELAELQFLAHIKETRIRPEVVFDNDKSGGRLTWEHLLIVDRDKMIFGGNSPWLMEYTEDRDLWRWNLPDSKAINAALRSYPLDFETWDVFSMMVPETFRAPGEAILRREAQIVDQHCQHAVPIKLCGYSGLQVNATVMFSEIAGKLSERDGVDFGACWFVRSDGKKQWSLRSRGDDCDVSKIASFYGGGGHKNAAGFESGSVDAMYPVLQ